MFLVLLLLTLYLPALDCPWWLPGPGVPTCVGTAKRLLLCLPGPFRACHLGRGAHRLVAPLAGAAGGPLPASVREAGVRRGQPCNLPVLGYPL